MSGAEPALALFLALVVFQRLLELRLSARNTRELLRRGAIEHGAGHYPLLIFVHVLFLLSLAAEVLLLGARPGPVWPLWLALWLAAQALRVSAIRTLGPRWTTRILTLPGAERVRAGPYRFFPHPNYLAVVVELVAAPMMFGAWRTALGVSLLNLVALRVRVTAEERALRGGGGAS